MAGTPVRSRVACCGGRPPEQMSYARPRRTRDGQRRASRGNEARGQRSPHRRRLQMKALASLLVLASLPALAGAEEAWRWTDGQGTIHYTNQRALAPDDAEPVTTRMIVEASRLPGGDADLALSDGMVVDAAAKKPPVAPAPRRPHRIYTEQRRRFDCYAGGVVFAGGWGHPDDIANVGNCLPYLLGPDAWLSSARAELAMREHGLDWKQVVQMYIADQKGSYPDYLTSVSSGD